MSQDILRFESVDIKPIREVTECFNEKMESIKTVTHRI